MSDEFLAHLGLQGITHHTTVHDTPEENGIAKRLNCTLLERIRAMLHSSGLPRQLWAEAVRHTVWLKNRTSTRALEGRTPYEVTYGKRPNLLNLPEWGTKVHTKKPGKLASRVVVGWWLGFSDNS